MDLNGLLPLASRLGSWRLCRVQKLNRKELKGDRKGRKEVPAKLPSPAELGRGDSGFYSTCGGLLPLPHVQFWEAENSCRMFNFGKPKTAGDWVVHIAGGIVAVFLVWWMLRMYVL